MKQPLMQNYTIIKESMHKKKANYLYEYLNIRYEATKYLLEKGLIQNSLIHGMWDKDDWLSPTAPYVIYGDPMMDLLMMQHLESVASRVVSDTNDLMPMCSYTRLYKKSDILVKHTDQPGRRKFTATVHLGHESLSGMTDPWPIYLKVDDKEIEINLEIGDMLVYSGEIEHWREPCKYDYYGQTMLHYTLKNSFDDNGEPVKILDGREKLGIPNWNVK